MAFLDNRRDAQDIKPLNYYCPGNSPCRTFCLSALIRSGKDKKRYLGKRCLYSLC